MPDTPCPRPDCSEARIDLVLARERAADLGDAHARLAERLAALQSMHRQMQGLLPDRLQPVRDEAACLVGMIDEAERVVQAATESWHAALATLGLMPAKRQPPIQP